MNQEQMKQQAALAAVELLKPKLDSDMVLGVGTGSTVNHFIEGLRSVKHLFRGAASSSEESTKRLKALGVEIFDLNSVDKIGFYVDGADEINHRLEMIKGGGGALTREKIIAAVANKFVCIADSSKYVDVLGKFPLPIEVIPMARSFVAREMVKRGGDPVYRQGFVTDNGNVILDVYNFMLERPIKIEEELNQITGVVCHGIFAARRADILLLGEKSGVRQVSPS